MLATDLLRFARTLARHPAPIDYARYVLAERAVHVLYPRYLIGDWGRVWQDEARRLGLADWPGATRLADRRFFLRSLLGLADGVPGDSAECGVWEGASSALICAHLAGSGRLHHLFDSFAGLSPPGERDGSFWRAGDLAGSLERVRRRLHHDFVRFHPGWIPERFPDVADRRFCFVHVDVDLYEPTRAALEFFHPRLSPGGVVLFDDYGFSTCPGARRAVDEFAAGVPERIVEVPTGQAFLIKR